MGQFSVQKKQEDDAVVLELSGQIDEDADFSEAPLEGQKIVLDLQNVEAINSCGIREWIKWVKAAPEGAELIYRHCPKIIVDQINMVAGFLPPNARVESFYVPYFCEESGSEKMVLFQKGKEFNGSDINPPEQVSCDETGEEMEMDVIESKYFKFLNAA